MVLALVLVLYSKMYSDALVLGWSVVLVLVKDVQRCTGAGVECGIGIGKRCTAMHWWLDGEGRLSLLSHTGSPSQSK